MKCELVNYKQKVDDTYLIKGILYENSLYFSHVWVVQTDDFFEILDEDRFQVYAAGSAFSDVNMTAAEILIKQTIRKNRLKMLMNLSTSDIVQDIKLLQPSYIDWLEIR